MPIPMNPSVDVPDLLRYLSGESSEGEALRVRSWCDASSANAALLDALRHAGEVGAARVPIDVVHAMERLRGRMDALTARPAVLPLVPAARQQIARQASTTLLRGHRNRSRAWWCALVGVTLGGIALVADWREAARHFRAVLAPATTLYTTGPGEQRAFGLPDGSTVALWESSRLEVPRDFRAEGHPLRLQGAAAFTVQHQRGGAFTVTVPGAVVRVLGTTFAVSRYAADTAATIAVRDGKVAVRADGSEAVVLTAARLMVIGQGTMRMAPFNGEQQYLQYLERGIMNPVIMLYSLIAMVDATPTVPVFPQPSSVAATAADSLAPPVLTDALLLSWHSALMHFGDTLVAHPELQKVVTPLLRHPVASCGTWFGHSPDDTMVGYSMSEVMNLPDQKFREAGLPNFPIGNIVKAIVQQPALVGAFRTANMTPWQFVATLSAIQQVDCVIDIANMKTPSRYPDGPLSVKIDPASTLGKNMEYLHTFNGKKIRYSENSRQQRFMTYGMTALDWGLRNKKRLEDMLTMDQVLNSDDTEKPLQESQPMVPWPTPYTDTIARTR